MHTRNRYRPKKKETRKWVKMEKRIVRAMYRAGELDRYLNDGVRMHSPKEIFDYDFKHRLKNEKYVPVVIRWQYNYEDGYYGISVTNSWNFQCHKCKQVDLYGYYRPCIHIISALNSSRKQMLKMLKAMPQKRNDHAINHAYKNRG